MHSTIKKRRASKGGDDDYFQLVHRFPLRPIRSRAEYDRAMKVFTGLIARADVPGLNGGESDYADVLGQLVRDYDRQHFTVLADEKVTPLDALKFMMEQHRMKSADLGRLLGSGPAQASLILNGKRELSKANIRTLAARFNVSAALFI